MRPGGPHAHSTGGRGYSQPPVYCSQHPILWQGTIPGVPTEASPGRGVHSTHQDPPWPPTAPQGSREWVKDPLARAIVSDTMERKRMPGAEIPPAPTGQMEGAGQTDMMEGSDGLTLPGAVWERPRAAAGVAGCLRHMVQHQLWDRHWHPGQDGGTPTGTERPRGGVAGSIHLVLLGHRIWSWVATEPRAALWHDPHPPSVPGLAPPPLLGKPEK